MAEPIKMHFGMLSLVGPGNHVWDEGAHWRNLANTIEASMSGGNAALCQIIFSICFQVFYTVQHSNWIESYS